MTLGHSHRLAIFLFGFSGAAFAQAVAGLGAISGTVRDPSGAVVPGAFVVVSNPDLGLRRPLVSTEVGFFSATSLVPGAGYAVTITKSGFASWEQTGITVQVGQNVALNTHMQLATNSIGISFEADASIVEQTKTEVSQTVTSNQIMNLPINGRRVDSFVLLAPAVVPDSTFGLLSFRGMAGGNSFLTDGNDTTEQYYNENAGRTRIGTQISQDAVQEFEVLSAGYSAEFGRASGGVINTVTRSGGNQLHGTGYWFFRNQDFNARDPFSTVNPPERRHQAGGSIGGPIVRDKVFYFFNGEAIRRDFPLSALLTNPPFFTSDGKFVPVQPNGQSTCGPPATAEQCGAAIHFLDRQFQTLNRNANTDLAFGKLDWRPTQRHSLTASFNYLRFISLNGVQTGAVVNTGAGVGNNATSTVRARYGRLSWTSQPSPTTVNEFRFGWFKDKQFDDVGKGLSLPGVGLLGLTVQGQANLGTAVDYPRLNPSENRFQFVDTLSWYKGRSSFKFGIDVSQTRDYSDALRNRVGTYTYPDFTSFALDLTENTGAKHWQTFSQRFGNPILDTTIRDFSMFAQDQVRLTAHLTVNAGVRYDYSALPQPIARDIINPQYPGTGRIPTPLLNFAPRLGASYALGDLKTVIRAGYGIFYGRFPAGLVSTFFLENGVVQRPLTWDRSNPGQFASGPVFPNRASDPGRDTAAGSVDLTFPARDFRNSYSQQADIAIERELGRNLVLTTSYIWNRGMHLTTVRDLNIGDPGPVVTYRINNVAGQQVGTYSTVGYLLANRVDRRWGRVNLVDSGGDAFYNGLAVQLRRRFSHGLEASVAYTWSHAIDYGQGFGSQNIFFSSGPTTLENGDYHGEKGTSSLDQRHRLVAASLWSPEFRWKANSLPGRLLNHWQISQISTFASSPPATGLVAVSGVPFPGAAYSTTLNGFGGSQRVPFFPINNLDIDRVIRTDARLSRNISLSDRLALLLSLEAFNVFNHTNFTGVITRAYNAAAGVLTPSPRFGSGNVTGGFPDGTNARRAQASLRILW